MQQCDAAFARPGNAEPQFMHLLQQAVTVTDQPGFDSLGDQRMCQVAQLSATLRFANTIEMEIVELDEFAIP
ncbi:hypothetical protein QHL1GM_18795 [Halomonas sp. QHL1]|nr:hypothetical protein [Halomonas sp. QHL1]OJA03882.1 hypothetical protein QHL1GM_18795 [Halomonas sp. QHL1]